LELLSDSIRQWKKRRTWRTWSDSFIENTIQHMLKEYKYK
jgi:hypothetical protein